MNKFDKIIAKIFEEAGVPLTAENLKKIEQMSQKDKDELIKKEA